MINNKENQYWNESLRYSFKKFHPKHRCFLPSLTENSSPYKLFIKRGNMNCKCTLLGSYTFSTRCRKHLRFPSLKEESILGITVMTVVCLLQYRGIKHSCDDIIVNFYLVCSDFECEDVLDFLDVRIFIITASCSVLNNGSWLWAEVIYGLCSYEPQISSFVESGLNFKEPSSKFEYSGIINRTIFFLCWNTI